MHRRTFLRRATATPASIAAVGTVAAKGPYPNQSSDVALEFDRPLLERFAPLLDTTEIDDALDPPRLYSWVARSDTYDTTVLAYWAYYPYQDGYSGEDSHVPDREPFYVHLDASGSVERVVYDGYHYLVARDGSPTLSDGRPWYHVIAPWHPYRRPDPDESPSSATVPPVRNLHDVYEAWTSAGWAVHRPSVVVPWRVERRGHWWSTSPQGRYERLLAGVGLSLSEAGVEWYAGTESDLVGDQP
jgi:hypothetical protein